jgi:hypothetical protein
MAPFVLHFFIYVLLQKNYQHPYRLLSFFILIQHIKNHILKQNFNSFRIIL